MITNTSITIFNGRMDKEERRMKYFPTVIRGVSYQEAKGATIASNGVWGENVNYKIRIPLVGSDIQDKRLYMPCLEYLVGSDIQDKRLYMPCLEYAKLEDGEAPAYWTIKKGDLIVRGEHPGDPMYEDALNVYARENSLDLIHVTEYADNTIGGSLYVRHYRIGGN